MTGNAESYLSGVAFVRSLEQEHLVVHSLRTSPSYFSGRLIDVLQAAVIIGSAGRDGVVS